MPAAKFALNQFVKIVDTSSPPYTGRVVGLEYVVPDEPYIHGEKLPAQWVYYIKVSPLFIVEALESHLRPSVEASPDPQR